MIQLLAILLPLLFLGGIVSTISGGGLGILLLLTLRNFYDIRTTIILMCLLSFAIQSAKIVHFSRHVRWDIVGWYLLTGIPASFLGGVLFFFIPERWIEIVAGVVCLLFVGKEFWRRNIRVTPSIQMLLLAGFGNGLIGGAIGQGAGLRLSALLAFGLTKQQLVGTSSIIAISLNAGKTAAYLRQFSWSPDTTILLLVSAPIILLSVAIGKRLLHYVSPTVFETLLLCIIFLGAVRLLFFP